MFQFLVATPPGDCEPSLAIAASRAGAIGLLDAEHARDYAAVLDAATACARFAGAPFGLKCGADQPELIQALLAATISQLQLVVLTRPTLPGAAALAESLRASGRQVLLEVTGLGELRAALDLPADGLVAKGSEAGGRVGEETAFVLLQGCLQQSKLPVYVHGGVGQHSVAACAVAGAAGALLDAQMLLVRESPLPAETRERIAGMDGSETICLGGDLGAPYRVYSAADLGPVEVARSRAAALAGQGDAADQQAAWREALRELVGWDNPRRKLLLIGQDGALAAGLARRHRSVAGVIACLRAAINSQIDAAARLRPLDADAPLARSHGTRYPIVQGPMTRVSDIPGFARAVADAGALPMLALSLMDRAQVTSLLSETHTQLGERPWGVGILGFVPQAVREQQLAAVREARPAYAIIAGGRPDQAQALEREGIATYLHVPSPGLLRLFLADGARRFIFEGRECGGHVGPRSSFVLWDSAVAILLEHLAARPADAEQLHILFAGGIHDARSAAMVAALAAPLAERGARIGVLMGTAYLFCEEAVASGALTPAYQQEALAGAGTVLLESGVGHASRCLPSNFVQLFNQRRRELLRSQADAEAVRGELEALNLGRLRIASKGLARNPSHAEEPSSPRYIALSPDEQRRDGMFMVGQVVALRDRTLSIAELHHEVSVGGSALLDTLTSPEPQAEAGPRGPARIAIVGMSCILPGAPNLQTYWENILNKVDAISEVPADRWDWRRFFDPDPAARDKIVSRWGGFIEPVPFDPLEYGMPPSSLPSIEPLQLLMLEVVRAALTDAGYDSRPFPRERTSVIVAAGGGLGDLGYLYGFRSYLPHFLGAGSGDVIAKLNEALPEWSEDSFPGILLNVIAGRVANRFDLGGPNFTVDAACGSSLAALDVALKDLESGRTDMAIVGAGDTVQSPFAFLAFSKTQALSPNGRCRPFDAKADGIAISEGLAVVVLKRLADAERDGDRIYAVIEGLGASSDGRDKGLTAPRAAGQLRALRRAYAHAGYDLASVGMIEAHGTGTRVGDVVETEALTQLFGADEAQRCALGSVKSMIGHTKSAAGLAGLIKAALALYHKVLPPTLVEQVNPRLKLDQGPFYVIDTPRPWLSPATGPRRAGVSAFGFGGTNFHATLEEYRGAFLPPEPPVQRWPAELLLWSADDRAALSRSLSELASWLADGNTPPLRDLAFSMCRACTSRPGGMSLAIVATDIGDLREKLALALTKLGEGAASIDDPRGIAFSAAPLGREGKLALLFPGQGSQYPAMLADLALHFPLVRETFEQADAALAGVLPRQLSDYIFPPPAGSAEIEQAQRQALTATDVAQPALGAAGRAISRLLAALGVEPEMLAGHSYGEILALWRAGALDDAAMLAISAARGRFMAAAASGDSAGAMAAIRADRETTAELIAGIPGLGLANLNSPKQTVISGERAAVETALKRCNDRGVSAQLLPVACAFHSPLVAPARADLAAFLAQTPVRPPAIPVYANATATTYPNDPEQLRKLLADQLTGAVEFQRQIEAMYAAGARIFVEAGPQAVLSGLVGQILAERPHLAVALDRPGGNGLLNLLKGLGRLAAAGVPLQTDPLFAGRGCVRIDLNRPYRSPAAARIGPTTWLVDGGKARPARGPSEPPAQPIEVQLAGVAAPSFEPALNGHAPAANGAGALNGHSSPNGHAPMPSPAQQPPPADEAAQILLQYQQLMGKFLEAQQSVMLAYLGGATAPAPELAPAAPPATTIPSGAEPAPAAPPEPTAPAPAAQPEHESPVTEPNLLDRLLALISERTGYPPEMLDPGADLEADLGIDSIKRVEILAAFRQSRPELASLDGEAMEQLQRQRTIQALGECLSDLLRQPAPALQEAPPAQAKAPAASPPSASTTIERFVMVPVETPLDRLESVPLAGDLLITDDGRGLAHTLAAELRQRGCRAVVLPGDGLANEATARALTDSARRELGGLSGLIHLAPLAAPAPMPTDFAGWQAARRELLGGSFNLIRAAHADLANAGGAGCLLVATPYGGSLAPAEAGLAPLRGAVAGLLKTLAHELPSLRVKAVDLDPNDATAAPALLAELAASDRAVEVGIALGIRRTLQVEARPLVAAAGPPPLDENAVVLVTGGARGITATTALELARRYRPQLVLVGRSPLPPAEERPETAGLSEPRELKAALRAALSAQGREPSLAEIEAAYNRLLHEREIRANLASLAAAGARVRYRSLDVRDPAALADLVASIYAEHGRLDGVIHGAGVIEDRLIRDKSADSFERVLATKADSAFVLSQALRPAGLKFLALFSSVSGHFGNRGQGDYAAANELLCELAGQLDRQWPGRVVALSWGPWDGGMVSESLRREFARRGVSLIPPETGSQMLVAELEAGPRSEATVLICGADAVRMAHPTTA